ncbi:hypothetical protein KI387_037008, partial [Taxus chinensis]
THIMSLGFDVWNYVEDGFTNVVTPTSTVNKKAHEDNSKAFNSIICGLRESKMQKIMHCKSAKEAWEKLQVLYEGDSK